MVDASRVDPVGAVRVMTRPSAQISYEAIGSKTTSEPPFEMLRPNDTALVIGVIPVGQ